MVVAMSVVDVVQVAVHQIVDVVAVRHHFVAATFPMHVAGFVPGAVVAAGAIFRVRRADSDRVLVDVTFVRMVQVPIVEIIHMPVMRNRLVSAARAVDVIVVFVGVMAHREFFPFVKGSGVFSVECARALKISPATCWSASE